MPNISWSKSNQIIKSGQLIKHNKINIFLQKSCRKWGKKTSSRHFFYFLNKKVLYELKTSRLQLKFKTFRLHSTWHTIKNKLHKTLDYWCRDTFKSYFLEKCLGKVSPPHFVYESSRKMLPILYSINWLNFIVWLPLLLETLDSMCITIVCFPGCDAIILENNLTFLIKPFF